jgi:hypothetical protein
VADLNNDGRDLQKIPLRSLLKVSPMECATGNRFYTLRVCDLENTLGYSPRISLHSRSKSRAPWSSDNNGQMPLV